MPVDEFSEKAYLAAVLKFSCVDLVLQEAERKARRNSIQFNKYELKNELEDAFEEVYENLLGRKIKREDDLREAIADCNKEMHLILKNRHLK